MLAQSAQTSPTRFGIIDNSYLVEEAFNQDRGVVQNIFSLIRVRTGEWDFAFTQEWPVLGAIHQFSYSIPMSHVDGRTGIGDVQFNYRLQVTSESPGRPAFAPRLSLILPTGDSTSRLGDGALGWQVNLPFSKQRGNLYFHWNAGFTYLPGVDAGTQAPARISLFSPTVAGSVVWQVSPTLNLLLETLAEFNEEIGGSGPTRNNSVTVSPGFRRAWDLTDKQIVVGAAVPMTVNTQGATVAVLTYFSYEVRFRK